LRIENSNRVGSSTARVPGRSGSTPAFQVDTGAPTAHAAGAGASAPAQDIGSLLALQSVSDPSLGRRRQLRRGRALLDTLDDLKADLLLGQVSEGKLDLLMAVIGEARQRSEPGLDAVLDDIELRARVELAKRGRYPAF
jgi:hypothetical protein